LHLRSLGSNDAPRLRSKHPFDIPAVQHALEHGVRFTAPVTFFVGENGTGKSTLLEAIAARYPRIGTATPFLANLGATVSLEESPLAWNLALETDQNAATDGFFLRASTLDALTRTLQGKSARAPRYRARSHGEGLLTVLKQHFDTRGFYLLDEPETALSFSSTLALIALLHNLGQTGSQVVCATHSPLLLSLPGAQVLEFGAWGIRETAPEDLELLRDWRAFLDAPERWLRHLLEA
jgi:predicted ATPase